MKGCLFFFALLFFNLCHSASLDSLLTRLRTEDGLPGDEIHYIHQDDLGFLWILTRGGVTRYDGLEFETWTHSEQDTATLTHDFTTCLKKGPYGHYWIGTIEGVCRINKRDLQVERLNCIPELQDTWITSIEFDSSGNAWIGTDGNGLVVVSFDSEQVAPASFRHYTKVENDSTSLSSDQIRTIIIDQRSHIVYVATTVGLNIYRPEQDSFVRFYCQPDLDSFTHDPFPSLDNDMVSFIQDKNGIFFIGSRSHRVSRLEMEGFTVRSFKSYMLDLTYKEVISGLAVEPYSEHLWVGTNRGKVFQLNCQDGSYEQMLWIQGHETHDGYPTGITCLFFDTSNLLWLGTRYGLYNCEVKPYGFRQVGHYPESPSTLRTHRVTSVYEASDGLIYVGTLLEGVEVLNQQYNVVRRYQHDPNDPTSLRFEDVFCFMEDANHELFVGTAHGLDLLKTDRQTFVHIPHSENPNDNALFGDYIYSLSKDSSGAIWAGTNKGIAKIERHSGDLNITNYLTSKKDYLGTLGGYVSDIQPLSDGRFLVGSRGLYEFSPATNSLQKYQHLDFPWINGMILFITRDSRDNFWIGTVRQGLYRLTPNSQLLYTAPDDIPANLCNGCLEAENGNMWIGTFNGLLEYDRNTDSFAQYDMPTTLENEFRYRVFCRGPKSGNFYFGHFYGFVVFDPMNLQPPASTPPMYITDVKAYNQRLLFEQPIFKLDQIRLNYKQKMFSFDFAAINFRNSESTQYQYMLEGFDDRWMEAQGQRTAQYTNINPGRYTFHVKAATPDNLWPEQTASLNVRILPPWWRTPGAYVLWIALFVGAIYSGYRLQLNRARLKQELLMEHEQAEKLQELDSLKSNFFANISHELRTPLTLILGPLDLLLKRPVDEYAQTQYDIMKRNARRLLRLVNQLLDFSKLEAGRMKLQAAETDLVPFVKRIVASFMSMAERKHISLNFRAQERVLLCYIDVEKFEKILNNVLSNAFKFTSSGGRVDVSLKSANDKHIELNVTDTGVGIPSDQMDKIFDRFYQVDGSQTRKQEGTGIGLALTKELIELHGGTISVTSQFGNGTAFTLRLPKGAEHLSANEIVKEPINESIFEPIEIDLDASPQAQGASNGAKKPLVLVVEDNRDVRQYIRDFLADAYHIREAENGRAGFDLAVDKLPDVIISDVMMPEMDGYELCRTLKTNACTSHIPVILLTARAAEADKLAGLEIGADDYIIKPFSATEVRVRVKNLIEQRRRLRQAFSKKLDVAPSEITVTSMDQQFLKRAIDYVEAHMGEAAFSIEHMAYDIGVSRMHLHRKLKALTDLTPSQFVLILRLKRAAQLLSQHAGTVTEIAYDVGFQNPSYFSACFRKQFGVAPSEYVHNP